jgi:hypothetical protein
MVASPFSKTLLLLDYISPKLGDSFVKFGLLGNVNGK